MEHTWYVLWRCLKVEQVIAINFRGGGDGDKLLLTKHQSKESFENHEYMGTIEVVVVDVVVILYNNGTVNFFI